MAVQNGCSFLFVILFYFTETNCNSQEKYCICVRWKFIFKAILKLSDFQRGRLLGMAEIIEEQNRHGGGEAEAGEDG